MNVSNVTPVMSFEYEYYRMDLVAGLYLDNEKIL